MDMVKPSSAKRCRAAATKGNTGLKFSLPSWRRICYVRLTPRRQPLQRQVNMVARIATLSRDETASVLVGSKFGAYLYA